MPGSDELGFLVILNLDAASWDSSLGEDSPVVCCGVRARVCWVRWNSQHSKNCVSLSLSPRVKYLKVKKVIKVSYLNQESRQCFVFFWFLCVWTFDEHVNAFIYLLYIKLFFLFYFYFLTSCYSCYYQSLFALIYIFFCSLNCPTHSVFYDYSSFSTFLSAPIKSTDVVSRV